MTDRLFNDKQFGQTCSKCGHEQELHTRRGCSGTVGSLECKCYRFHPLAPQPAQRAEP